MRRLIRVLFISISAEDVMSIKHEMEKWSFSVASEVVSTYEELGTELNSGSWDLIISNNGTGRIPLREAISLISQMGNRIPVIVVSDNSNEECMLEAINMGCSDYILKNDFIRLRVAVDRILRESEVYKSQKKMISECFENCKRLSDTLDSIGDGIIITDKKGSITMLNKVAQSLTGWMQQEALGKPVDVVFNIIDKVSRLAAENPIDKIMREGKATGLKSNTVLISKDFNERYVSANCAPIVTQNGGFEGAILVFRDITRIKLTENEIINEQRNLMAIFDAAPVGMLLLDKNVSIKKVNNAIYNMAGKQLTRQNDNKKVGDILKCPRRNNCEEGCGHCNECRSCQLSLALQKACCSDKAIIGSDIQYTVFINEDNKKLWLRISSVPLIIDAERHTLVIVDDITGLKQLQEELKKSNQELENTLQELKKAQNHLIQQEKLAGIGQLAAGVAHEINNPMGFVMSNFETLKRYFSKYQETLDAYRELKDQLSELGSISTQYGYEGMHNESLNQGSKIIESRINNINNIERKENIHFIVDDIEDLFKDTNEGLSRISKIIMGLRLFSRVDQQNEIAKYDLNEGIRNTLIVANNEIKYFADVEENLQNIPLIYADGGQINQVLLNLIVNAVHAIKSKNMEEKGIIKISTGCDDKYVYCSIKDSGVGIPEDNLNKIFDPFYTTKSAGKGTGLGLSISYDIVANKHGGELLVSSVEGEGSEFTIYLPLNNISG